MGIGDDIMALGEAKLLHQETGLPVAIGNRRKVYKSVVYQNVPFIASMRDAQVSNVVWLDNYPGHRPYIDYEATRAVGEYKLRNAGRPTNNIRLMMKAAERWVFKDYTPVPAEIILTKKEREMADGLFNQLGPYVVIEPHIKRNAPPGKDWGWQKYVKVANVVAKDIRVIQVGQPGLKPLPNVTYIATGNIRSAIAILQRAVGFIGPEGGLHHGAAAVNTPGVVIYGGYVSPTVTGYNIHKAIYSPNGSPCGSKVYCRHCEKAMEGITVQEVTAAVRDHLFVQGG